MPINIHNWKLEKNNILSLCLSVRLYIHLAKLSRDSETLQNSETTGDNIFTQLTKLQQKSVAEKSFKTVSKKNNKDMILVTDVNSFFIRSLVVLPYFLNWICLSFTVSDVNFLFYSLWIIKQTVCLYVCLS